MRTFARWQQALSRLRSGQYAADNVVDYLQNKEHKVLLFTDKRLIYININRQQLRWSFAISNLTAVSASGELIASTPPISKEISRQQYAVLFFPSLPLSVSLALAVRSALSMTCIRMHVHACMHVHLQTMRVCWYLISLLK